MDDPIEQHLDSLVSSGYSNGTLLARRRVLATLPAPLGMTRESTQEWWESRRTRANGAPRAPVSRSGEASHCREFWRWAMRQGLIDRNPADWLPRMRLGQTMAVSVPEGDLYRLLRDAPPRTRQMIVLAGLSGLRSAEVAAIRWEDIDHANGILWVRQGKGSKDRSVPLSAGLLAELGEPGTGPIVGKAMTGKAVSAAIGRYMRARGVDLTAHKLRARYATRFLAATGDAVATAEVLGHADLSSIRRYAVASSDTKRRGAEAAGRVG